MLEICNTKKNNLKLLKTTSNIFFKKSHVKGRHENLEKKPARINSGDSKKVSSREVQELKVYLSYCTCAIITRS